MSVAIESVLFAHAIVLHVNVPGRVECATLITALVRRRVCCLMAELVQVKLFTLYGLPLLTFKIQLLQYLLLIL